jgi:hypothetical protein
MGGVVAAVRVSAIRFAPSRTRERKIPSGTSGCRTHFSTTTKPTRSTTEDARAARVAGTSQSVQPGATPNEAAALEYLVILAH